MQPMNTFLASTKDSLRKYFDNLINVTEPENYLGYLENKNSTIVRCVIISPQELYDLLRLLLLYESSVVFVATDPLLPLLRELAPSLPTTKDKLAKRPTLLQVVYKVNQQVLSENQKLLIPVKNNIVKFLSKTNQDFEKNRNQSLLEYLVQVRATSKAADEVTTFGLLDKVIVDLPELPDFFKNENWQQLLNEIENDYTMRVQYHEYLLMDKIELLQAIELHKASVTSLSEERKMFYEYLENAKRLNSKETFRSWIQKKKKKVILVAPTSNVIFNGENGRIKRFD